MDMKQLYEEHKSELLILSIGIFFGSFFSIALPWLAEILAAISIMYLLYLFLDKTGALKRGSKPDNRAADANIRASAEEPSL
jgi:predicted membrane protein